jgi:hypothetical protein
MPYPDDINPYGQPPLPYMGHTDPLLSQRQEVVSRPTTPKAGPSHTTSARSSQATSAQPRLSKAEALAFVRTCKRWLVAGSIVTFGILSGLVAGHVVGTTFTQATPTNQATPASNTPTTSPSSDGSFFQQQGGYGFGNGNSWQPPVSSSHVS